MKKWGMILAALTMSTSAFAAPSYSFDVEYFETLNKQKVISEDYIKWEQFAPGNAGYSEAVNIHPTDPNTLFNSPDMGNHYVSHDQGNKFLSMDDVDQSIEFNSNPSIFHGLDFSRQDADFGIAGGSGLWVTHNRGDNWSYMPGVGGRLGAVAVDPTDDNIWYAGTGRFWNIKKNYTTHMKPHGVEPALMSGLYKTSNKGAKWGRLSNTQIPDEAEFSQILVNPFNPLEVYAGTSYGLYKSVDAGKTFIKLDINMDKEINDSSDLVRDVQMYVDEKNQNISLVAISQIRYFLDGEARSIGQTGGIVRSDDGGATWIDITGDMGFNLQEAHDATMAATGNNYVKSWFYSFVGKYFNGMPEFPDAKNNGAMAAAITKEYPNLPTNYIPNFDRIAIDPTNPDKIYVSHNPTHGASLRMGDVWTTDDGGAHWYVATRTGRGWIDASEYWAESGKVAADADLTKPNVTYHHAGEAYYYDEIYTTQGARDLDIGPDGTVYVMFRSLVKSTDGGATWEQIDVKYREDGSMTGTGGSNMPGGVIVTDPRDPSLMYLGTDENGTFKVVDKGAADAPAYIKHLANSPAAPAGIAISPDDINTMYMTILRQHGKGEVFRSTDAGENWSSISKVYSVSNIYDMSPGVFIIDPNDANTMYFTVSSDRIHESANSINKETAHRGVWKSTDGGYNWVQKNVGLPTDASPYELVFDPSDSNILYTGMLLSQEAITAVDGKAGVGMYVSYDGAESWELMKGLPKEVEQVNDITFDSDGNLYIAAGWKDRSQDSGGVWVRKAGASVWQKIFELPNVTRIDFDKNHLNRLIVLTRPSSTNSKKVLNNGIYISEDYGNTWKKVNMGVGNPTKVYDVEFDSEDPQIVWLSHHAGGYYKGYIEELDEAFYKFD